MSTRPRIGIDARFFGPSGTGPGRYVQRLVEHLVDVDDRFTYVLFIQSADRGRLQLPTDRFEVRVADYRWYSLAEQIALPGILSRAQLDLMHFPHFNVPLGYRRPFVVTIHDLIITHFPTKRATTLGPVAYAFKQAGYRVVIRNAATRAQRILTVSEYSKRDLQHAFHLTDDRIVVTYEAADLPTPTSDDGSAVRARYGLHEPYLLYVGNAYPHKNLERYLRGYGAYRRRRSDAHPMVFVGKRDYFSLRLERAAAALGLRDAVQFTGFVPDADLPAVYRGAAWYVFPSLYEGFGLPPLEAMAYDVPVISSDATCLPEILGDAASYFSPTRSASIARILSTVVHDPVVRDQCIRRGRERVQTYSWERMTRQTVDVYAQTLGRLPGSGARG